MPEIVLNNAPLLKAISGDLATLRQYFFWVFVTWACLSAIALGVGRKVSISIFEMDISKIAPSLCLLAFCVSVGWLYFASELTAGSISGYKDRMPRLDLSSAGGATSIRPIIELLDGGFGLDAACAFDPNRGASFVGSNLCWSVSGTQITAIVLFFLTGCLTVILIFRALYLKGGSRHDMTMIFGGLFCIIASMAALTYVGNEVATAAETTILHELQRAGVARR